MKKDFAKKIPTEVIKKVAKEENLTSSPRPKLSKKDPEYYAIIGKLSAAKRNLSKEYFSEMAKKSHNRPASHYRGGRKKKTDAVCTD